jgi:hypothetical protein
MPFYFGDPSCKWGHAFDGDMIPVNLLMISDATSALDWQLCKNMGFVRSVEIAEWDAPLAEDPKEGLIQNLSPRKTLYHLWKKQFTRGVYLCIGGVSQKTPIVRNGKSTAEFYVRSLSTELATLLKNMPHLQSFWYVSLLAPPNPGFARSLPSSLYAAT